MNIFIPIPPHVRVDGIDVSLLSDRLSVGLKGAKPVINVSVALPVVIIVLHVCCYCCASYKLSVYCGAEYVMCRAGSVRRRCDSVDVVVGAAEWRDRDQAV